MCPDKTCYAPHTQSKVWPYGHIWRTVVCRTCKKLVDAQTPHPNPSKTVGVDGGNKDHWLTVCVACDIFSVYPQSQAEIECLRKNAEKPNA